MCCCVLFSFVCCVNNLLFVIFDENSELDIRALLDSVDSFTSDDDDEHKDDGKKKGNKHHKHKKKKTTKGKDLNWNLMESYIQSGNQIYIDTLLQHQKITINVHDEINCFNVLECAMRYNQIDIISKMLSSYIGNKLGNKLLCFRYHKLSQDFKVHIYTVYLSKFYEFSHHAKFGLI